MFSMPKDQINANHTCDASRITVADLYPKLSPEEQVEAEDTIKSYIALVWRIYQRVRHQKDEKFDENLFKR